MDERKVIVDGEEFDVSIESDGDVYRVSIEDQVFEVKIPGASAAAPKRSRDTSRGKKSGTISANIPGKVVTIDVSFSDRVEEGQVVLILEAMKMQNEITAPVSGVVESIHCSEGESIEANVPLVVIKPDEESED